MTYEVLIALGTGNMAGDLFGPQKQFQVIGEAMSIAEHLEKAARGFPTSSIWMSQYSVDLLKTGRSIQEAGTIIRENTDALKTFMCALRRPEADAKPRGTHFLALPEAHWPRGFPPLRPGVLAKPLAKLR